MGNAKRNVPFIFEAKKKKARCLYCDYFTINNTITSTFLHVSHIPFTHKNTKTLLEYTMNDIAELHYHTVTNHYYKYGFPTIRRIQEVAGLYYRTYVLF
jgi:hypothetical protein